MPAFTRDLERTPQGTLSIADEKGRTQSILAHAAQKLVGDGKAPAPMRKPAGDALGLVPNDDVTPMEIVAGIPRDARGAREDDPMRHRPEIRETGCAERGAYPRDTAAAAVAAVAKLEREGQHSLHRVMEPIRGLSDALLLTQPRTIAASGPGDRQRT